MKHVKWLTTMMIAFILFVTVPLVGAKAASNPYARDYSKTYTFSYTGGFGNSSAVLKRFSNKQYRLSTIDYFEGWDGNKYYVATGGVGYVHIPNNVKKTKRVTIEPFLSDIQTIEKRKVTFNHRVKTKYKTFKNCMKYTDGYTTIYFAPKYGAIKYVSDGFTFQLKKVK
ncbi:hypothetical protein [Kurthia massiliensis]|uniref:hypothetical protein n=1 Tax=Kurthia massiliensis TaxID=1033739 RepID=UPI000287DC92|nr:hypothetical protein [Kurthia massiliensis]